jgi:hypothetical protein
MDLQFQVHSVVDFVICESNVVFVRCVALFKDDFFWGRADLGGQQLFEVSHGVVGQTLYSHLLADSKTPLVYVLSTVHCVTYLSLQMTSIMGVIFYAFVRCWDDEDLPTATATHRHLFIGLGGASPIGH